MEALVIALTIPYLCGTHGLPGPKHGRGRVGVMKLGQPCELRVLQMGQCSMLNKPGDTNSNYIWGISEGSRNAAGGCES